MLNEISLPSSAKNPTRNFVIKIQKKTPIIMMLSDITDYDTLLKRINVLAQTYKIQEYTIIQDKLPWDDLPNKFEQCLDHLTLIVLKEDPIFENDKDNNISPTSYEDSTLNHFLNQPEAKALYYLQGEAYKKKIYEETDRMLNTYTDKNQAQLQKFVGFLKYFIHNAKTEKDVEMYQQWIIKLASMTSFLPPSLTSEIKKLSQHVFNHIIM